ncbi:hypothetical protein ACC705_35135, partial [Rhizobium ruizarguesonis]
DFHDAAAETLQGWRDNIAARLPLSTAFHVGGERWVNMDATVSRGQHWLALFTDVTELKSREEEIATRRAIFENANPTLARL